MTQLAAGLAVRGVAAKMRLPEKTVGNYLGHICVCTASHSRFRAGSGTRRRCTAITDASSAHFDVALSVRVVGVGTATVAMSVGDSRLFPASSYAFCPRGEMAE